MVTAEPPRAALVDLDGTVVSGDEPLDGAATGIAHLRDAGVPTLFVTNRATETAADHAAVLRDAGVDAAERTVLTSAHVAASALEAEDSPALVIGDAPLREALTTAGLCLTDDAASARTVVASVDTDLGFDRLTAATRALAGGARFVATNPDGVRPSPDGPIPETGTVAAALRTATGETATVLGKPNPRVARAAVDRLNRTVGVDVAPHECLVVGDNRATDVELGRRVGATTVLVDDPDRGDLSRGATGGSSAENTTLPVPNVTIDSLAEVGTVLETLGLE